MSVLLFLNAGILSSSPIVISISSKVSFGFFNCSFFLTTVKSLPSTLTAIGFNSLTVASIKYVFVLPFWAVTLISILLSPSSKLCSPKPLTLALDSFLVPVTLIFSTLFSTSAE